MAVVIGAVVVGAAVSIMGNNAAAAAQQDAINRQAYADRINMIDQKMNIEFMREFTETQQKSDDLAADINFVKGTNALDMGMASLHSAQQASLSANATNNMWSNIGAVAGAGASIAVYKGRTSTGGSGGNSSGGSGGGSN
jgi:hypothetical protein